MSHGPPTLVYDGDCAICRYWVTYWQGLTNERVVYRPYQEAATDFPTIPLEAFQRAIQFIEPDGHVYSGAAATFRVLRQVPGRAAWWWCYSHLPGFAGTSEWAYEGAARRRGLLNRVTTLLWGPSLQAERSVLVSWVFLRLFGAIYVAAFASLGVQILGLIGHAGILPLGDYLEAAHQALGNSGYLLLPSLFWVNSSDTALVAGTVVGALLGLLVVVDRWTRPALIGLFALYLSYVYAGQDFMSFQWDVLLLEAGFLAIFLTGGSRIVVWLYRWLVFRYLFLAGIVKLLSGDPTWHGLTALEYHFWTQPLPTPLAWYAAQLPPWLLIGGTAATLIIELGSVFLIFLPRRLRAVAACCVLLLQSLIVLTGNYNFFNLLTMLLCVFLFDDVALGRLIPQSLESWAQARAPLRGRAATVTATALALICFPLFRPALWNIPHQPRLDWQMWFASLGSVRENPWIVSLMRRLLEGSPSVLALLDSNPFADGPPKYVRAQLYEYRFADRRTHIVTGQWWVRRPGGLYFPQVSLADFGRAADRETAPPPGSSRG